MAEKATAAPKILFVDDEENILKALRRLCVDESFEVFTALSGQEAMNIIRDHEDIAVIVSDQRMPAMTGTEFLEMAREVLPDAIRILLTGYADISAMIDAINRGGAYRYMAKPWKDDELLRVLKESSDRYAIVRENRRLNEVVRRQNEELQQWTSQLELMVQEQTIDIQKRSKELERLNNQLKLSLRKSIEAFSGLIEMRDRSVSSHSRAVASFARDTAAAMALPDDAVNNISVAALLHDIGKIGIPDSILAKQPETLTGGELKEYELHSVRGQITVAALEGFEQVGLFIRHHHEYMDGSGFPDGKKKQDIPLGSRIIAVADAVDRLANLGKETDYEKALKEVEAHLDARYDRQVFHAIKPVIAETIRRASSLEAVDEFELHPSRLLPGMMLTRDVRSGTGLMLLSRGTVLDANEIEGLMRYFLLDPSKKGVFVSVSKGAPK